MQTIKHRTIDAILKLPDTAGIKDIEILLKKIARESKRNIPEALYSEQTEKTLAGSFKKLRQICLEENYQLEVPKRFNRENLFYGDL